MHYWPLAVIMIVIASWALYRYVAPERWRDWSGAGLVQAFIIALYAEMYGFPLTIYLLVRFFGLDSTIAGGNLWASIFDIGQSAMIIAMIVGYGFVLVGLSLVARGWREIYRARKEDRLATQDVYGVVRHPQYLGIFLALFGEGIVHWPTVVSVALFPLIVGAYVWLARREEREAQARFGVAYSEYRSRVPAFIPRRGDWRKLLNPPTRTRPVGGASRTGESLDPRR